MAVFKHSFAAFDRELSFTEEHILDANRGLYVLPATAPEYAEIAPESWLDDMLGVFDWNGAVVVTAVTEDEQERVREHGGTVLHLDTDEDPEEALDAFYGGLWPRVELMEFEDEGALEQAA